VRSLLNQEHFHKQGQSLCNIKYHTADQNVM